MLFDRDKAAAGMGSREKMIKDQGKNASASGITESKLSNENKVAFQTFRSWNCMDSFVRCLAIVESLVDGGGSGIIWLTFFLLLSFLLIAFSAHFHAFTLSMPGRTEDSAQKNLTVPRLETEPALGALPAQGDGQRVADVGAAPAQDVMPPLGGVAGVGDLGAPLGPGLDAAGFPLEGADVGGGFGALGGFAGEFDTTQQPDSLPDEMHSVLQFGEAATLQFN